MRVRGWMRVTAWSALTLALVAVLVWAQVQRVGPRVNVSNLDYFGLAARAKALPGDLDAWVSGFYPVGIPLLLRLGLALGVDVVRGGQAISLLGAIAGLLGAGALTLSLTHRRGLAVLVMAFVLGSGGFLFYAGFEGSDMLAAGLQVLALGVLLRDPRAWRITAAAGLVTGLAYLARYTALITALLCGGWLLVAALAHWEGRDASASHDTTVARAYGIAAGAYAAGFLLGAAPQLVTSLIVKGTPLYMTQTYHIWIKLYGESDFIAAQGSGLSEIGLWALLRMGPGRFLANWWREFWGFWYWMDPTVVAQPLHQVARAGWLFTLLDRRLSRERRLFLGLYPVGFVGALSLFNLEYRFLLALAPLFAACAVYMLWRLLPARVRIGRRALPVGAIALTLLWLPTAATVWTFAQEVEGGPHAGIVRISQRMRAAGAQGAHEVVSTNLYHQDVASPTRDRYGMLYDLDAPEELAGLRQALLAAGRRFVIYDDGDGLRHHPQYAALLQPEARPAGFTPVWIAEDRHAVAYRIEPAAPTPQQPLDARFADGVRLVGYDLAMSADHPGGAGPALGLTLTWEAPAAPVDGLKVFVHLLDGTGALAAQHDSVPCLWTYPTGAWAPGERVIDFHPLALGPDAAAGAYTLAVGLYDGATGARQAVVDAAGAPVGDQVALTTLGLAP